MTNLIEFIVDSILKDRRLRLLAGISISLIAVMVASLSIVYGLRINDILDAYLPAVVAVLISIAGLSLALSTQRVTYGRRTRQQDSKGVDDKELIKSKSTELSDMFHTFRIRMLYESERLRTNSFKNLAIGIIFSFAALILLTYFVLWQEQVNNDDYVSFITNWIIPRLAIVLLLQFVGFFFLRLYVASELDLKHNKNEMTNIEAQIMAYAMSKEFGSDLVRVVVEKMSSTERNFVIKSGEKTISIENDSQYNDIRELLGKLVDKIPDKK